MENISFLLVITILINVAILSFRIGYKDYEKNVKKHCIRKTIGKIEHQSKGVILNGIEIKKARYFFPHPYTVSPNITILYHTVYSYTVGEKQYLGIDARKQISILPVGKSGDVVDIFYNPNDAREFYCPKENRNAKYGYLIIILLFNILMMGLFLVYVFCS